MIKLTFCLRRLPHLSLEDFQAYWLNRHAPLVASVKGVLRIRRYVQLHSAPPEVSQALRDSRAAPEPFDGVAQLWWDSPEDLARLALDTDARAAGLMLLEDEARFIDLPRSPLFLGAEHAIF